MKEKYLEKSWINPKIEIKESPLGGKGMFTKVPIAQEETVVVWGGQYTGKKGADEARSAGKLIMHWDVDLYSIEERGDDQAYFINHSCDPNIWMKGAFTLVARKEVKAGEEILADYALWEADENYISSWECLCNSVVCRKRVTGKDWQQKEIQTRYKEHFSPLINKRIEKLFK